MLRRLLLGVVVSLLASTALSAQVQWGARGSFPGCPRCGVWSWVDLPEDQVTVSSSEFVAQGWGFECISGQAVDRVDVQYQDYNGDWRFLVQPDGAFSVSAVQREDVVAFGPTVGCSQVAPDTGWQLRVTGIPVGLRRVRFVVWKGPYWEAHYRTYLVIK